MNTTSQNNRSQAIQLMDRESAMSSPDMENTTNKIPETYPEALRLIADQAEELERTIKLLEEQKSKVLFADAVINSTSTILIGELAKLLRQNGENMTDDSLFEWLRNEGYLVRQRGPHHNLPTAKSGRLGLFEVKRKICINSEGTNIEKRTIKVTGKGQVYFVGMFLGGNN